MPTISAFYGIVIRMYFADHAPPHFYVVYGDALATIDIRTLSVRSGRLPPRALDLTLQWASAHQDELIANRDRCSQHRPPRPIEPLE